MAFAFIFDSVGGTEWLVLLGVILIVVGPKNLPSAARKLGQVMAQLRRAADEFKRQILSMDEEIRSTVEDAVKTDDVEAPKDAAASASASDGAPAGDGEDRAAAEADYYGEGNPYPGHEFYDETHYQDGAEAAASTEPVPPAAEPAAAEPPPAPEKPKADPYAIKITVTTAADGKQQKKGKGRQA